MELHESCAYISLIYQWAVICSTFVRDNGTQPYSRWDLVVRMFATAMDFFVAESAAGLQYA